MYLLPGHKLHHRGNFSRHTYLEFFQVTGKGSPGNPEHLVHPQSIHRGRTS